MYEMEKREFVVEVDGGKVKKIHVNSKEIAFANGMNKRLFPKKRVWIQFRALLCHHSRRVAGWRIPGLLDLWFYGSLYPWFHGSFDPWVPEFLDPWGLCQQPTLSNSSVRGQLGN